ncbi:cysteine peptidase family C39 domain-containing protein [Pseudomonas aeruginosa]|uniref:cysteine peptidase family C39 domain-containing protein n=1 Tax=Pseudomonas aeruginosa TaxID=287 RepID=UPI0012FD04FA|nr:cysteine peptidase family C39 domain-containing protein [Pseudomonas aeruginosa]ELG5196912.1 hypothetical protein [Pseudomonas aeruginosa]ELQ3329478.1 hypothetical protein [Pseudomonas aeruginosa]MBA5058146.1 hypothetical protein [Pseudomonas aeruginosa]MBK1565428.1 hypothetical protein [Pseudomonas aeruginosa]MBM9977562.1 hypothetical protein [Pseudomonas aeruginosa]
MSRLFAVFLLLPILSLALEYALVCVTKDSKGFESLVYGPSKRASSGPGYEVLFKQKDAATCGAASLAYLITRLGGEVYEEEIVRRFPRKSPLGYSISELINIASEYGLEGEALKVGFNELPKFGEFPVVSYLRRGHYLLVLGISGENVVYFDSAYGEIFLLGREDFLDSWDGIVIKFNFLR